MKNIVLKYFYNTVDIPFFNNKSIHEALDFTDTEPKSESEEEFNEDTI